MPKAVKISKLGILAVEVLNNPNVDTLIKFQNEAQAIALEDLLENAPFSDEVGTDLIRERIERYRNEEK